MVLTWGVGHVETLLVAAAVVWCGCSGCIVRLWTLFGCSLLNALVVQQRSAVCRPGASSGLVLGTVVLPTLFAVQAGWQEAIAVAFRLTWYAGMAANAVRLWRLEAVSCGSLCWSAVALIGAAAVVTAGDALLLPALVVFVLCLASVQRALPCSFTFGEAVVVAELLAVLCHFMLVSVVLDVVPLMVLTSKLRTLIAIGLFSAVGISAANLLLGRFLRGVPTLDAWRGTCLVGNTAVLMALMLEWMSYEIGEQTMSWLWSYVTAHTATPLKFIIFYVAVLIPGVALAPGRGATKGRQIVMRKYFHLLALVIFVPTILINIRFMTLAFAVALAIFMVIESLRVADVPALVAAMNPFMEAYVDDRDSGAAVLTHIYLLLGCALPVFFTYFVLRGLYSANGLLIALSGVAVTGLGDAMASFCGVNFGRHRWYGTKKTVEGTAAMIVSVFLFQVVCLYVVGFHNLSGSSWARLVASDVMVALLEAKTEQIDNVFLPLYHVALLQMV
eukprot:TRINITY_DN80339_c0_g1_i1.p1 TRINITY_DN80339_c0_g1~~TRINITY_DN80339_c0_g1_i1.p1  ORF type:complete len:502 (-),score=77.79 TRINITY_DN80339_c0_g1_i1:134-1639(-)